MPDEMFKAAAYHGQGDVPCPMCLHVIPSLRVTFFLEEVATFLPVSRELWRGCLTMWFSFPRRHATYPFSAGEDTKEKERQQCPEIIAKQTFSPLTSSASPLLQIQRSVGQSTTFHLQTLTVRTMLFHLEAEPRCHTEGRTTGKFLEQVSRQPYLIESNDLLMLVISYACLIKVVYEDHLTLDFFL